MPAILTDLDRALDRHDALSDREKRSRRAFQAHRRKALVDETTHPLRKTRLTFRGDGLTVAELSERSTVSESLIRAIEAGGPASDATFVRLMRALDVDDRSRIDKHWIKG